MRRDSLAFAVSGVAFGLLVGWIIGTQQVPEPAPAPVATTAAAPAAPAPPALDQARVSALEQQAAADPRNAAVRVDLANLYFDAERFNEAVPWYEAALALNPKHVDAGTDLAIAYFYQREPDRALTQLDRVLAIDSRHVKALLNQGYIRALGKQDLVGAAESWEKVVSLAPNSEEARRARLGLDGIRSAHQAGSAPPTVPSP